jgi:hypothetical protein
MMQATVTKLTNVTASGSEAVSSYKEIASVLAKTYAKCCHLYVSKKFPPPFGSENFLFMERLSFCNPGCIGSASIRKLKRQGAAPCATFPFWCRLIRVMNQFLSVYTTG